MTTDQYTPIYTRKQGEAYLDGWRDRREAGPTTTADFAFYRGTTPEYEAYFRRGWTEADFAIRLGRNIGQCGQLPRV